MDLVKIRVLILALLIMWACLGLMNKHFLPNDPVVCGGILKDLATAVLFQALRDLKNKRPEVQLDAALFLASDDATLWMAVAQDDDPDNLQDAGVIALSTGRIKNNKRLLHERNIRSV